jgi:hypothetical protein
MRAKVVKLATACREANYTTAGTLLKSGDSNSRDSTNVMNVISRRTARTGSRKISISRKDSNIQQGHQ